MKQSDPGHFFESQGKTFQPFPYTLFLKPFLTKLWPKKDHPAEIYPLLPYYFNYINHYRSNKANPKNS